MKLVSTYIVSGSVRILNKVVINTPMEANNGSESNWFAKIAFVAPEGMAAIKVQIEITMELKFKSFKAYAVAKGIKTSFNPATIYTFLFETSFVMSISAIKAPISSMERGAVIFPVRSNAV